MLPIKEFFADSKGGEKPEDKTEKKPQGKSKDEDEDLKQDGKRAMEMILNDPNLKKAFYTQPSLWNLFVAELKGKKATGKGIVPTLKIVGNYESKGIESKLGTTFIEGDKITFRPVGTTKIPFTRNGKNDEYVFDENRNIEYHPKVLPRKLGEGFKVVGEIQTSLSYEIEILDKVEKEVKPQIQLFPYTQVRGINYTETRSDKIKDND